MRELNVIAREIETDWQGKVNFAARPYLSAMHALKNVDDYFGADSGRTVVSYFLSNATTWRGEKAREIKKELKKLLK